MFNRSTSGGLWINSNELFCNWLQNKINLGFFLVWPFSCSLRCAVFFVFWFFFFLFSWFRLCKCWDWKVAFVSSCTFWSGYIFGDIGYNFFYLEGLFVFLCYIPICALFLKSKNTKIIKKKKSNKKKFDHKVALKTHKIHNATFE